MLQPPRMHFAYPVRRHVRSDGQVELSCRDLPELSLVLPAIGDVRVIAAAEAVMDMVFETYLNEGRPIPHPSAREPDEGLVSPSPALISRAVKQLAKSDRPLAYPVRLESAHSPGFGVFVNSRDFPGVLAHGNDQTDAIKRAAEALALRASMHNQRTLPLASAALKGEIMVTVAPIHPDSAATADDDPPKC